MMRRLLRTFWTRYYEFRYRHRRDDNVCCCGSPMDSHSMWDGHPPTSEYDYVVYCAVQHRMGDK